MPIHYQWNAADYARHSAPQFEWAQELIAKLNLKGNEAVLDIGCGDGKNSAFLAGRLPDGYVLGIDLSFEMLVLAQELFLSGESRNLDFCQMDAAWIGLAGNFDIAFSNAALHWIPDQLGVLLGVRKALKPSGRLLFQMGGRGNGAEMLAVLDEIIRRDSWEGFFEDFTFPYTFPGPEEYKRWLEQAGLEARRIELIPKDMQHAGREGLAGWLRTAWLPYTQRVPLEWRARLIDEVIDAYAQQHPPDSDGVFRVAMVRLEVAAVRR